MAEFGGLAMQAKTISARFPGKCVKCHGSIAIGEPIVYDGSAWHLACHGQQSPTTKPTSTETTTATDIQNWLGPQPLPMHQQCTTGGVWRYDSISQICADWKRVALLRKLGNSSMPISSVTKDVADSFYTNSQKPSAVLNAILTHNTRYVKSVMVALDKIPEQTFESLTRRWTPTHWGTRMSITDYTTGVPTMFRRRQISPSDHTPINVYIDITAGAECTAKTLANRGALILAAVERLQMLRAVSVKFVSVLEAKYSGDETTGNGYIVIDVPSTPVSIAEFSYPVCDSSFLRMICFSIGAYYFKFDGGWPKHKSVAHHRAMLGLAPDDVWLEALHRDNEHMLEDPARWLQTHFGNLLGEPQTRDNVATAEASNDHAKRQL